MAYRIGQQSRCCVIGYGSWATALVKITLENEAEVGWYIRKEEVREHIRQYKTNPRSLRSVHFYTHNLKLPADIDEAVSQADIVILAVPSVYLKMTLEPLVCVKNASLVWERGCGSGTTALGAALATKKQDSLSLGLKQPGGVMQIDAEWKDGCLYSLTLTVRVKIVAAGTAYLESF